MPNLPLVPKVTEGRPPYAWLLNGAPLAQGLFEQAVVVPDPEPGFMTLTVVDADGRSARTEIELRAP